MPSFSHCIICASNYTGKKRKGLHYLFNDANIHAVFERIKDYATNGGISIYFINTDSEDVESVMKKDRFFETMSISEGTSKNAVHEFEKAIINQILIFDIALLLLTRRPLTYANLNLYLFFIYAEYYLKTGEPLFDEKVQIDGDFPYFAALDKYLKRGKNKESLKYKCKNENVLLSKFFNCEDGIDLMNDVLDLFRRLMRIKETRLIELASSFVRAVSADDEFSKGKKRNNIDRPGIRVSLLRKHYASPFVDEVG